MPKIRLPKAGTTEIAPSILNADFGRLGEAIAEIERAGVRIVHLDVMDGHFVPNITIGPPVIEKLRKYSSLVFDAHLMISEPAKYAEVFAKAGANHITFHIEVVSEPEKMVEGLHNLGVTAGVCINPETPVESIKNVGPLCEMVLVMSVYPGFGGQEYIEEAGKKCIAVRQMVGPDVRVEVDGGISAANARLVVSYGADTLVVGSAIFAKAEVVAAINELRAAIR